MDMRDENLISTIFSDNNLSKDERYMILALKYYDLEGVNIIKVSLKELVDIFGISKTAKVQSILKSLESKGYISMEKIIGKTNRYSFIKESLIFTKSEEQSNDQIAPSTKKVCPNGNDQMVLSAKKVCPKSNDQMVPSTKKVCPKSNNQIVPSTEKVPGYDMKNSDINENEIMNKACGIAEFRAEGKVEDICKGKSKESSYINNNIYNNKLYINIFNTWNKININREAHINPKITDAINTASKSYSEDQIIQAIENYSKVYHSNHYYNHPWKLVNFLSRANGINRFMENGDIWVNYKEKYEEDDLYGLDFDIEKYID